MARRSILLVREAYPAQGAMDTAISRALLKMASDGRQPETLRLYRPGAIVAFGPQDAASPTYGQAVWTARNEGFEAVLRLAGGRAAVFHQETIAFSWTIPEAEPKKGILPRFQALANIMRDALTSLGVDARIGEVEGEYCPGSYSVNARGESKLMGVGQRLDAHASHVGGVLVVGGGERVRRVLTPVYAVLGLNWRPETAGSVQDELPGITMDDVERALVTRFGRDCDLMEAVLSDNILSAGRALEPEHRVL